jgi:hypothetical protein
MAVVIGKKYIRVDYRAELCGVVFQENHFLRIQACPDTKVKRGKFKEWCRFFFGL